MGETTFSVAITGAGGKGAITAGNIMLAAAAHSGHYGLMSRSVGPQIRGGESAAMVRIGSRPVNNLGDQFDLLIALDWLNTSRFADELPLGSESTVISDPAAGSIPDSLLINQPQSESVELDNIAKTIEGGRSNMVAVGIAGWMAGFTLNHLTAAVETILASKGEQAVTTSSAAVESGFEYAARKSLPQQKLAINMQRERWNISGNEAAGLGALRGGVRFVAAYPITPATEILEWLTPHIEKLGGSLVQAEDELASINMVIGGSFGGIPSLTATSGPGLSLMLEGIGLAIASETPVVVVNVNRGGPSTGIPTKSEQSDLNIALYGPHGDAPHLVAAPLSIADCCTTIAWVTGLAEKLQTAAIVLSDQSLGQSRAIIDPPLRIELQQRDTPQKTTDVQYQRYQLTESGISPMAIPGSPDLSYVADGLEHDQRGKPSSQAIDHQQQLEKRRHKIESFDYGDYWATIDRVDGEIPDLMLITWGGSTPAVEEAMATLRMEGYSLGMIAIRLLHPLSKSAFQRSICDSSQLLVVEQNQSGQLFDYLHAQRVMPADSNSYCHPGPLPIRPNAIVSRVKELLA